MKEVFDRAKMAESSASVAQSPATSRQTSINGRLPSHVADFSQTLPREGSGPGRFVTNAVVENETEETMVPPFSPSHG